MPFFTEYISHFVCVQLGKIKSHKRITLKAKSLMFCCSYVFVTVLLTCVALVPVHELTNAWVKKPTPVLNSLYKNIVQFLTLSLTAVGLSFHTYFEGLWLWKAGKEKIWEFGYYTGNVLWTHTFNYMPPKKAIVQYVWWGLRIGQTLKSVRENIFCREIYLREAFLSFCTEAYSRLRCGELA